MIVPFVVYVYYIRIETAPLSIFSKQLYILCQKCKCTAGHQEIGQPFKNHTHSKQYLQLDNCICPAS